MNFFIDNYITFSNFVHFLKFTCVIVKINTAFILEQLLYLYIFFISIIQILPCPSWTVPTLPAMMLDFQASFCFFFLQQVASTLAYITLEKKKKKEQYLNQ